MTWHYCGRSKIRTAWHRSELHFVRGAAGRSPPLAQFSASGLKTWRAIALLQQQLIDVAARDADVVVCDTTPLMTAVYSQIVFGDDSLVAMARALHASTAFTLLTGLDIAWTPDGLQRDGPHVRVPVDDALRGHLLAAGVDWAVVTGAGDARTGNALAALRPVLAAWCACPGGSAGLFSALLDSRRGPTRPPAPPCPRCDPPPAAPPIRSS